MSRILVCGGAGYIGSHLLPWLSAQGHTITTLDNLSTGHRAAVQAGDFVLADLADPAALDAVFAAGRFDAVVHFAARSLVGESVARPLEYYQANVTNTLNLLVAMQRHGVSQMVFSSTAAVYGQPQTPVLGEDHPTAPINPYGASKRMVEQVLADAARAHGLRSVSLRYFNAAGARVGGVIGESHTPETHLIPNVLRAAAGTGPALRVFGDNYPTPDGTGVRDYVHVDDLAQAHAQALAFLESNEGAHVFNLGNGHGFSVREVIAAAERVTGRAVPYSVASRRPGDPAVLVASSAKARAALGWEPRYTSLDEIVATAWAWHRAPRY